MNLRFAVWIFFNFFNIDFAGSRDNNTDTDAIKMPILDISSLKKLLMFYIIIMKITRNIPFHLIFSNVLTTFARETRGTLNEGEFLHHKEELNHSFNLNDWERNRHPGWKSAVCNKVRLVDLVFDAEIPRNSNLQRQLNYRAHKWRVWKYDIRKMKIIALVYSSRNFAGKL